VNKSGHVFFVRKEGKYDLAQLHALLYFLTKCTIYRTLNGHDTAHGIFANPQNTGACVSTYLVYPVGGEAKYKW
jgi:hypothetical protein